MPKAKHPDPDASALDQVRAEAAARAERLLADESPDEPLARVAWAAGVGSVDRVRDAVEQARLEGFTWPQIATALGENPETVRVKYGSGYEAQRRYRERKRTEG